MHITLVCENCGNKFSRRPSEAEAVFCSYSCLWQGHTVRARARRTELEPPPVERARWVALNRGFALVDADRFDELNAFVWSVSGRDGQRAARGVGEKTISLHHAVLDIPSHIHIDHKNVNGLDCRRDNLRVTNNSLNHANMNKRRTPSSSQYKGVSWDQSRGKWLAMICITRPNTGKKRFNLGRFPTEQEAAAAYDAAAIQHFGEFARTNFPRNEHESVAAQ